MHQYLNRSRNQAFNFGNSDYYSYNARILTVSIT